MSDANRYDPLILDLDGLLVLDWKNGGNGRIDNGEEIFGDHSPLKAGGYATNGYQALADWDDNHDGRIDAADGIFPLLQIWQDTDSDGYTDAGELHALSAYHVQAISLGYTATNTADGKGNTLTQSGHYTLDDGSTRPMGDYKFAQDLARTLVNDPISIPAAIAVLPELRGFGTAYDLHQAMARDGTGHLQALVEQYIAASDPAAWPGLVTQIIYAWTGVENVNPTSRGTTLDARKVCALEVLLGEAYRSVMGGAMGGSNVNPAAAPLLEEAFSNFSAYVSGELLRQTHLKSYYDGIALNWDATTGAFALDVAPVLSQMQTGYASDPSGMFGLMQTFAGSLRGLGTAHRASRSLDKTRRWRDGGMLCSTGGICANGGWRMAA